jgi:hypothetical protein
LPEFIAASPALAFFLPFLAGAAVSVSGAAAWGDFCRKVRVFSRKRVRYTFFFFLGAGGV